MGTIETFAHQFFSNKVSKLPKRLQQCLLWLGFGLLNFIAGAFCLYLFAFPTRIPALWLPSGILLAILFTTPRSQWPAAILLLTLADFAAGLFNGLNPVVAVSFSFSHTIESILAILLIQRFVGRAKPSQLKKLAIAVAIGAIAFLFTSLLAAAFMASLYSASFINSWLTWYLSDSIGVLMIVPIVLAWNQDKRLSSHNWRTWLFEAAGILGLLAFVAWMLFFSTPIASGLLLSMPYLVYPILFWAALRLGLFGAAAANCLLAILAFAGASQGMGPLVFFGSSFLRAPFLDVQVYLVVSALFTWTVVIMINGQKAAEQALRYSERRIRTIFQHAPVFVGQIDSDHTLTFNNWTVTVPKAIQVEQTQAGQAEGVQGVRFPMFAALTPDHLALLQEAIQITFNTGKPWQHELAASEKASSTWYEVRLSPILVNGKVESVILTANEITERKLAEEALRTSEERFSLAVRGANDGIWDWDLDSNQIYFSQRWKKMLGYSESEISASPDEWLGRIHPDDLAQVRQDLRSHLEAYTPHFVNEHRIMHKGGAYRWVLVRGLAIRNQGKQAHRLAGSLTDITARKTTEERLLHDAMHDVLTGLPNRAYFLDQLRRSIQRVKRHSDFYGAVLFIDLDRFKLVNESFGHVAGDQLLLNISHRLETSLRPQDTIARFGGDEFAVLLDDVKSIEDAIRVANRIHEALTLPFMLQGQEVFTTASVGIVVNTGNYERPEDLLRDADSALYGAKSSGRGRHQVFDTNMRMRNLALLQLETDLRRGIDRQEFEVYYQPIVALPSGRISSLEALIRWHHPERGMVMPNDFIAAAEENGLIVPINEWVMREAFKQLKEWLVYNPNLRVSINLSARQLQNPNFPSEIAKMIADAGLEGSSIQLEVTESAAMQDFDQTIKILTSLSNMGILISLDDFGMQYSSLDYLKRFPVTMIKIDKSFILGIPEDGEGAAITRSIISVGHLLNKYVVAEGVESTSQLDFLHQHQCDEVQGYLYSQPQDQQAISLILKTGLALVPITNDLPLDDIE